MNTAGRVQINDRVRLIETSWQGMEGIVITVIEREGKEPWFEVLLDTCDIITLSAYQIERI